MAKAKKEPRWVAAFLRALARTGDARAAAKDAGIDHTTAYARRRAHEDFAGLWRGALVAHAMVKEAEQAAELEALRNAGGRPSPGSPSASPTSPASGRGELVASGGQVKRSGQDRWGKRKEAAFFAELAATANVSLAAEAAGVSENAVYQRRLRDGHFRAQWAAVRDTAKASIDMHLLEETKKSFDPDTLDTGGVQPRVTIDQAIRISQSGPKAERGAAAPDPFEDDSAPSEADEVDAMREQIVRKLRRMRDRDMPEQLAQGWSFDEEYDVMVPPGWVRAENASAG
jgi:hypothetical protein